MHAGRVSSAILSTQRSKCSFLVNGMAAFVWVMVAMDLLLS
jgi:hypothetical protein